MIEVGQLFLFPVRSLVVDFEEVNDLFPFRDLEVALEGDAGCDGTALVVMDDDLDGEVLECLLLVLLLLLLLLVEAVLLLLLLLRVRCCS